MKAVFVELPPFERHRAAYFDDDAFLRLQRLLILNPEAGDVIPGTGGLRKLRFSMKDVGRVDAWFAGDLLVVGHRLAVLAVYSFRQG